jgi:hypothetical protein
MSESSNQQASRSPSPDGWRNRIVGSGGMRAGDFLANPHNWRIHPKNQQDGLAGVLDTVGWVQEVIVNQRTGFLVDGHLRVTLALRKGEDTAVPVKYVDLSEEEEALILAALDPIAAMAATDRAKLDEVMRMANSDDERVQQMMEEIAGKYLGLFDDAYTSKLVSPCYEPSETKPPINELYSDEKTNSLIGAINDSSFLSEDEKRFLVLAANRHVIFNYKRIADYYSNSPPEVQRLMEDSALVIIDYKKAIEDGFLKFSDAIMNLMEHDYEG